MKARWVSEAALPCPPGIGRSIVASWIPGVFHQITTLELSGQSPLARLTESIKSGQKWEDVKQGEAFFVTQIIKCNRKGISRDEDYMDPVYERKYERLDDAKNGHKTIVELFASGKPLPPA